MENTIDVRLHQLNPVIADIEGNTKNIIAALRKAEEEAVDLLVVPELSVCGYPPLDLLERPGFRQAIAKANEKIIAETKKTALIFGTVRKNNNEFGRPCFNAAIMAQYGKKVGEVHKALLPTYDVFDEDRYFEPNRNFSCIEWEGRKIGLSICEDIWMNHNLFQYYTYAVNPIRKLAECGVEVIINVSASPFTDTKSEDREKMLMDRAREVDLPIFYVNQVGGNTELISDGDSMILNSEGEILARAPLFEEAFLDAAWHSSGEIKVDHQNTQRLSWNERVFQALCFGLKDYVAKTQVTDKVVLGLSGGIDSSLVACIAAEALGPEKVMGVAMPSEFSSEGSLTDAEKLAENLGIELQRLPIKSLYDTYLNVLEPLFEGTEFGVAEENLQSRARGMLLMAISNKFDRFVLNTGNKSELATGYCTLYGDMNGALAVIADLYKTEVFQLAQWLNESYFGKEVIPGEIIRKPPSAELRPGQKDTDSLPDYDKLDNMLELYLEKQLSVDEIKNRGFNRHMVEDIVRLVNQNEYKRYQAPPVLKIHDKAFGSGRRWPLVKRWE